MLIYRLAVLLLLALLSVTYLPPASAQGGASPAANVLKITHGAHLRPSTDYGARVAAFNSVTGKDIGILMYFLDWRGVREGKAFDDFLVKQVEGALPSDRRPAIMLTWQPLNGRKATGCARDYSGVIPPADIINGLCDNYIRSFARELKARPERFLLRFAHEMNIADIPWWPGHFGGTAALYVAMYRHVHGIFSQENVTNVEWMWSPNYASHPVTPGNDLHLYYPGGRFVDWIGLSGYNWYTSRGEPWRTFSDLYDAVLEDLACRYPKPQIIAEVGSVDGGPGKAAWIGDAYGRIPTYPFLRSIVWFNDYAYENPQSADFRVTRGQAEGEAVTAIPGWTDAYKNAIASSLYNSRLPSLSQATPPTTYCPGAERFRLAPTVILAERGWVVNASLTGVNYGSPVTISVSASPGVSVGPMSPSSLSAPWGVGAIPINVASNASLGRKEVRIRVLEGGQEVASFLITVEVLETVHQAHIPATIRD